MTTPKSERMLRLSIAIYNSEGKTPAECHAFGTGDNAAKAAAIHAKHGIQMYQQCYSPVNVRKIVEQMNTVNNRGWVIDDHDVVVEFYFRTFAEFSAVTSDPDFIALQNEDDPFVSSKHTVASLAWVQTYVKDGKVVNIADGKSTYPDFAEISDVTAPISKTKPEDFQA